MVSHKTLTMSFVSNFYLFLLHSVFEESARANRESANDAKYNRNYAPLDDEPGVCEHE